MKRIATAIWNGTAKDGSGHLTTTSKVLNKTLYTWKSRFEEGVETNPEELIAAAHAGCFSMKFSLDLNDKGYTPDSIETSSAVTIENGVIKSSHLIVKARVPGIDKKTIDKIALGAKENCPVSKALNLVITMELTLI